MLYTTINYTLYILHNDTTMETHLAQRRSEFPSLSTGFTALPSTCNGKIHWGGFSRYFSCDWTKIKVKCKT